SGQHCDGTSWTGSYQVTFRSVGDRPTVAAAGADRSPQGTKASQNTGQPQPPTTVRILAAPGRTAKPRLPPDHRSQNSDPEFEKVWPCCDVGRIRDGCLRCRFGHSSRGVEEIGRA